MNLILAGAAAVVIYAIAVAAPLGVGIGRAIRRREQQQPAADTPPDFLADMPVECLSPREIHQRFLRIVAPYDAERQGLTPRRLR